MESLTEIELNTVERAVLDAEKNRAGTVELPTRLVRQLLGGGAETDDVASPRRIKIENAIRSLEEATSDLEQLLEDAA